MPQLAGEDILASDIWTPRYVLKTGSESVTSSTVMQDDDDLFANLSIGVWRVQLYLHYSAATAGDIKTAWTTTGTMSGIARTVLGGGLTSTTVTDTTVRLQGLSASTATPFGGNPSNSNVIIDDLLVPVTAAGILQLQWAQDTSSATPTTVTAASRLYVTLMEEL